MALTRAEAAHLCRRVGFGGTAAELDHFTGMETTAAVDEILAVEPASPSAPAGIHNPNWWEAVNDMRFWWVDRMIDARWTNRTPDRPSPLEEKMTLFWHSHFATGVSKVEDASEVWKQNNILRNRGRGSFGALLDAICTNGALLRYLDNDTNVASNPQENFARELMELYTIGPTEFVENDVIEMTRAWTGHGVVGWVGYWDARYEYRSEYHDHGNKVLFGLPPQRWNGPETLSIFTTGVKRDATARFLAAKLWRFFVNDAPTEAELDAVVAAFLPGLDITDALRAILLHPTFWAPATEFALVRSPMEIIVQMLRQLQIAAGDGNFIWQLESLGHQIFEPPSVAGWGTGDYWIGTGNTWAKAQWLISLGWNPDAHAKFEGFLDQPSAADAAAWAIAILGIPSASAETTRAFEHLWTEHNEEHGWRAKHNVMVLGGMCPEMQVA